MAGFTDTLRGDGLARAQRALAGLEGDPQRLDRARIRFDDSPPPYTSDRSGTTTRSQSPSDPSEEERRLQERRIQLFREREASEPHEQFSAQVEEERRRIWNTDPRTSWMCMPPGDTLIKEASETVKKRWVEQGIWNSKWNQFAYGRWKHEEPFKLESESETDTEAGPLAPLFSFFPKPQPKPRLPKSDNESRQIAERRVIREREREASRPFHQFFYQVSKERERIQDESASGEGTGTADINTRAYEKVKNTWSKRGIWNKRWGVLPGMLWKHEEPLEEETADGPAPQANSVEIGSHEVGEASIITMNGAPLRNIFGHPVPNLLESGIPSPVESNHRQVASVMNTSQQGPSTDVDLTGLENGDAERSPSPPNSPRFRTGRRVLRPTTGQASRPGKREPSHKEGQPVANTSLGPVHPSKISKATGKKRAAPQRRPRISKSVSSGGLPLSSAVDSAKVPPSPARVAPRRSQRIQPPESGMPNNTTGIASTDSIRGIARSRPRRNVAGNPKPIDSTKPQRISKRQSSNTTRGKSSKNGT
jgi:hypothetical protein